MFPGSQVFQHADDAIDVYRGEKYVSAWRKSGAGNWVNASVDCGAENEEPVNPDKNHAAAAAEEVPAAPAASAAAVAPKKKSTKKKS